ncbi:S-layer homology domain-containing protein [Gudongella sp. DL1XJH-153]|uniref:S-layer homology domain-containing protein n=1 Tax=Gudongella sp. DL1XJH-153 TaxID=3409804 RepID=UPI003BB50EA4
MNRIKFAIVLTLVLTLLLSGVAYAAQVDYDFGYDEGVSFYSIDSSFESGRSAFRDYRDYIRDADPETYDEISTLNGEAYADFEEGFIKGYEAAMGGLADVDYAEELGKRLGETYALTDYYEDNDFDWEDALPSDRTISRMFDLDKMDESYEDQFIIEFIAGFKEGYENAYERALFEPSRISMSQGLDNGKASGAALGNSFAERDYLLQNSMNYERNLPRDSEIIDRYRLDLGTNEYEDAFIEGFKEAYEINYNQMFRRLNQQRSIDSLESIIVPAVGDTVTVDNAVGISVEPGTFYMPVYVSINQQNTGYFRFGSYVRASEIYSIRLDNPANTLDDEKKITIAFPYYGDKYKAGIYKLVNEKWYYIPSTVEDGAITAKVLPSTMSNREGVYAVFMDENIRILTDVRDHWANPEIETMVRRNIIMGYPGNTLLDATFRPSQSITRAEFLILLSRIENWTLPNYIVNATHFKDYAQFSSYDRIISYGLSKGYVIGYADGTFRPYSPISYYEVELIMGRVMNSYGFRWNTIATQMMYEKAYRSPGLDNINNKITRAEVAFMLYVLNQWRY